MRRYVIVAAGDNEHLHKKALKAAVEAVEAVNKAPVYRARVAEKDDEGTDG
jgi:hypothetical protein